MNSRMRPTWLLLRTPSAFAKRTRVAVRVLKTSKNRSAAGYDVRASATPFGFKNYGVVTTC
jgi:hypothetical protein